MDKRESPAAGERLNRRAFMGKALAAGALAAAGIAGATGGCSALFESIARTGVPSDRRPNILILYSDQHNARVLGCAGHPDVKTPRLDGLAAAGVRFERAYCQDGICCPSRTTLMTGLYPRTHGVLFNGKWEVEPWLRGEPLAAHLRAHGYRTGAFGKRHLGKVLDRGWDVTATTLAPQLEYGDEFYWRWIREIGQWEAFQRDWDAEFGGRHKPNRAAPMASQVSRLAPEATMEAWTARKAIDFIRHAAGGDQPFFCWCSFYRPHQPYTPLPQYYGLYDIQKLQLPASLTEPADNLPPLMRSWRLNENPPWCLARAARDVNLYRHYIGCYYGCLSEVDYHAGAVLDALEQTGQAGNTIVIYTADHGDFVGYHGMIEKDPGGHNVYEETLRVPLIVSWPGRLRRGEVREDLVETTDLYPTLLELAGIGRPAGDNLPGRSLAPALTEGAPVGREVAFSENMLQLAAIGERYKLGAWIERPKPGYPDMLFDRAADPLEMRNLHGRPEAADAEKALRAALEEWIERTPVAGEAPLRPVG
ncbi:MAG: sulfatase-like hydrolase/transferase [bacterium]|nr:sulfatase-like hydrolase/transferase [bacterium]